MSKLNHNYKAVYLLFGLFLICGSVTFGALAQDTPDKEQEGYNIKLEPKIKITKNPNLDPIIPLSKIKPFLSHSKILSSAQVKQTWPSIQAFKGEHLIIGKNDTAYAQPIAHRRGTVFSIFRLGKILRHPATQESLGTEAEVIGEAELVQVNEDSVGKLKILKSFREIQPGDLLMPLESEKISLNFKLIKNRSNKGSSEGQIIDVGGGVSQIGQYQVVTITGGKDCGRRIGEVLAVSHQADKVGESKGIVLEDRDILHPKEKTGELWVVNVFDQVSYALVVNATQPIYLLDTVASP